MRRQTINHVRYILEQWLPPIIRDSDWFSRLLLHFSVGRQTPLFMTFKSRALALSPEGLRRIYQKITPAEITPQSDASTQTPSYIYSHLKGKQVLEVGCGRGYLANELAKRGFHVTATDLVIGSKIPAHQHIKYQVADIQHLPFPERYFDTVVSTHTLEHVQDLPKAIGELRRVYRRRLLVVVPQERPYRYTPNLHLHFFPYPHSLIAAIGFRPHARCFELAGDLVYQEDH